MQLESKVLKQNQTEEKLAKTLFLPGHSEQVQKNQSSINLNLFIMALDPNYEYSKAELDNHSNQLNENNDAYWESRGYEERPEDYEESEK